MENLDKAQIKKVEDKAIFGSFFLLESEFALSVSHVQEVVNAPMAYTQVPLAPNYLKGLFNLRGTIVPVIDLKELLGLKGVQSGEVQKIAVVEISGACLGLLFDKTGEVFKSIDGERSDFESSNSESVISGVFKKDAGKRIVQILEVAKLFKLQNIPIDTGKLKAGQTSQGHRRGGRKQCISFLVGPAQCSLPISDIQEIIKVDKVAVSALGTGDCIGTIDLRGVTVPVIDFPAFLKYRKADRSETATQGDRRIVVMRLEKELFGLLVDSINSIISFYPDQLLSFPILEQKRASMFLGCITGATDSDILLLDHQKILTDDEVNEITRGHSKLYQTHDHKESELKSKVGPRSTYITFNLGNTFAVTIDEIKEIIDNPQQLMQPPGLDKHVKGVLNLRGNLVTIVDARSMYRIEGHPLPAKAQKVLIFRRDQLYFGLVVDGVESIITSADQDKIKIPKLLLSSGDGSMSSDVSEAIEVTDNQGSKKSVLILSTSSLFERALKSLAA
jgi:purine-binding chemotaxis protein CheW